MAPAPKTDPVVVDTLIKILLPVICSVIVALVTHWLGSRQRTTNQNKTLLEIEALKRSQENSFALLSKEVELKQRAEAERDVRSKVLPEAWRLLAMAEKKMRGVTSPMRQYPDLKGNGDEAAKEVVAGMNIAEFQKKYILSAQDPNKAYREVVGAYEIAGLRSAILEAYDFRIAHRVQLPTSLNAMLDQAERLLLDAGIVRDIYVEKHTDWVKYQEEIDKILKQWSPLVAKIESEIRDRISGKLPALD